jgi:hypothetical protein
MSVTVPPRRLISVFTIGRLSSLSSARLIQSTSSDNFFELLEIKSVCLFNPVNGNTKETERGNINRKYRKNGRTKL